VCTKSRAQGVCDGRTAPNKEIGRFLSDTLAVVPRLGAEQFGALFNDSVQDVLLVR
jgi:translation initiation factor 3 subunit F